MREMGISGANNYIRGGRKMYLDFTLLAYTVLAVYILMGVVGAWVAFFVIRQIVRSLKMSNGILLYPKEVFRRVAAKVQMSVSVRIA